MTTTKASRPVASDRRTATGDPPAAGPPVSVEDAAPETLGAVEALPRLLKLTGAVVGPATLLTALLFQFGRLYSAGYFRYFGVNFTVLDLTTNDLLASGADGLFVPVAAASIVALLAVWLDRLVLRRFSDTARRRTLRVLIPVAGVAGIGLMTLALLDLLAGVSLGALPPEAGGLSLAIGTLLLVYAVRLVRLAPRRGRREDPAARRRTAAAGLVEWGAAFMLVSVGLFWSAGDYAFGVGTGRAMQLDRALAAQPAAVLYSQKSLSLDAPGITEVRCQNPDAAYRYRYDGLRLVRQAGNQYLLLPATWTRPTGTAVLIPRSDTIRLEFRTAATANSTC